MNNKNNLEKGYEATAYSFVSEKLELLIKFVVMTSTANHFQSDK